ncbi:DnaJ C-terminal domain-containing protein [Cribrihabitans neustonicus]|uniref:DnaJ C-terminal domain-containing protein n=1 Tax=Cribrihabitans neustonicus TaxID=1429085 RepID=UPI003B5B7F66
MKDDPYKVLGVPRDATQSEIKKAYRKLAKALHPDRAPGDTAKAAEFQRVGAAYDILGDPSKRRRFDAGEIDASGQERPHRPFYRNNADARRAGSFHSAGRFGGADDLSDLFGGIFGRMHPGGPGGARGFATRGADVRYQLEVDFLDAARGARRNVPLPTGQTIELAIPAGVRDGQTLRLLGKGQPGAGGGPAGDAYVEIGVRPHPLFTRTGNDIEIEVPVTFDEAVLGARIEVPTISGPVALAVPKGSSSGRRLRLKGKGVRPASAPPGDQYVRLRIVLPGRISGRMEELARQWRREVSHDPRAELGGAQRG